MTTLSIIYIIMVTALILIFITFIGIIFTWFRNWDRNTTDLNFYVEDYIEDIDKYIDNTIKEYKKKRGCKL